MDIFMLALLLACFSGMVLLILWCAGIANRKER